MDGLTVLALWLTDFGAGSLLAIGVITVITGRVLLSPKQAVWSRTTARLHGSCSIVQGATAAVYGLCGGLSLGAHMIPLSWLGSVWAIAPFAVVMLLTLALQTWAQYRGQILQASSPG